ncbi:hypothetical protein [Gordonia sp. SL306]|uniref:hypothetical protein n=1 Tax=Gordonia sp. SL306 TaxID=2995145 RepID=UPI00226DF135|nr:hypothetical protein [Gordonia sp. SL306]WAC55164.1 hypothetical protein OVA31_21480 [Gordonia sp. SL306]
MTAAIEPDEILRQMWSTASSADAIDPDWIGEVLRHATTGRPDLALQVAKETNSKEHSS